MTTPKTPSRPPVRRPRPTQSRPPQAPSLALELEPAAPAAPAKSEPRAIAHRPASSEAPAQAPRNGARYVAVSEGEVERIEPLKTRFFESIKQVQAMTALNAGAMVRPSGDSLAKARGYSRDDLLAIAEIAYHYLFSGGTKLALTLYEGLTAIAPDEPYFALALGLTHDHMGERALALEWYERAGRLDPGDARPDVNAAELYLEGGDTRSARQLLQRAVSKAKNRGDAALERKATAILSRLPRAA